MLKTHSPLKLVKRRLFTLSVMPERHGAHGQVSKPEQTVTLKAGQGKETAVVYLHELCELE